jgi:hypothetical protein
MRELKLMANKGGSEQNKFDECLLFLHKHVFDVP